KSMGFGAEIKTKEEKKIGDILRQIMPEDLLKYGMIPEFIGRVPVIVALDALDKRALIDILVQPKNALVKQYQRLMDMDGVELEFQDEALQAIADLALEQKTGARGLRSILESILQDTMYLVPSESDVKRCVITKEVVLKLEPPRLIRVDKSKNETA
ncbi:MAG: ATP-dependent Clp protease ATP-binding subunit ClpX, partial [Limnochordia bacterium]